jgi:phage baseplate assembly protein gpV
MRDVIDGAQAIGGDAARHRLEVDVPVLALSIEEIQKTAANAIKVSARAMVRAASSTSSAIAQTPGPWVM